MLSYVWKTGLFELMRNLNSNRQPFQLSKNPLSSACVTVASTPGAVRMPRKRFGSFPKISTTVETLWKTSSRPTDIQICSVFVRFSVLKPHAVEFRSLHKQSPELIAHAGEGVNCLDRSLSR